MITYILIAIIFFLLTFSVFLLGKYLRLDRDIKKVFGQVITLTEENDELSVDIYDIVECSGKGISLLKKAKWKNRFAMDRKLMALNK